MLREAISNSESLIVIASRQSARSYWVNEEILHFKRTGRSEKIFAVIVDGEPCVTASSDPARSANECFPPALRFKLGNDGQLSETPAEPLGIDLRKQHFSRALTRLVAGVLDIPFDSIWRRHRRRSATRVLVGLLGTGLAVAAAGVAALTITSRQLELESLRYQELAKAAVTLSEEGYHADALAISTAAAIAPGNNPFRRMFAPDGIPLVRAALAKVINRNRLLHIMTDDEVLTSLELSPDGRLMLLGYKDGRVIVQDSENLSPVQEIHMGEDYADHVAFLGSTGRFVTLSYDDDYSPVLTEWSIESPAPIGKRIFSLNGVSALAVDRVGTTIALGSEDGRVRIASLVDGDSIGDLDVSDDQINAIEFASNGGSLAVAHGNFVSILDPISGHLLATTPSHPSNVSGVSISRDNQSLATSTNYYVGPTSYSNDTVDNRIRIWNLSDIEREPRVILPALEYGLINIHFLADAQRIVSISQDNAIRLWEIGSGEVAETLHPQSGGITFSALSDAGKELLIGGTGSSSIWDVGARSPDSEIKPGNLPNLHAVSPDRRMLVTADIDGFVSIWDNNSGTLIDAFTLNVDRPSGGGAPVLTDLAISADSSTIAASSWSSVYLWDVEKREVLDVWETKFTDLSAIALRRQASSWWSLC